MTTVVVVDDQEMVREGFRSLLEREPDIDVVGEASDGDHAVDLVRRLRPDVTLMDIRMPRLDGISATRRLVSLGSTTRVVVLTTFDLDEYVFAALHAGASGFLLKDATARELVDAVRVIAGGHALLAPAVTRRVVDMFVRRSVPPLTAAPNRSLTPRETEVLTLVATGLANVDIGRRLHVTEATVKTHVSNLLAKLDLRDRVHAVIYAYEHGIVQIGGSSPTQDGSRSPS